MYEIDEPVIYEQVPLPEPTLSEISTIQQSKGKKK